MNMFIAIWENSLDNCFQWQYTHVVENMPLFIWSHAYADSFWIFDMIDTKQLGDDTQLRSENRTSFLLETASN